MIPLQLKIRNFLSYGSTTQTVDFEPYRLICLSGKNGHGKSALLDALTWCIWGQARKASGTARSEEHLLHMGQTSMLVSLDFLCNSNRYRIAREYTQQSAKKSQTQITFGLYNEQSNSYVSLTETTGRDTQEKIIATLGLDYEACVSSIFMRQGNANEFSKKSPQERKEILAAVIGLTSYELLRQKALERCRVLAKEHEFKEQQCQALAFDCARYDNLVQAIADPVAQLETIAADECICEAQAAQVRARQEQLQKVQTQVAVLDGAVQQQGAVISEQGERIKLLCRQWRATYRQMRRVPGSDVIDREVALGAVRACEAAQERVMVLQQELLVAREHLQKYEQGLYAERSAGVARGQQELQEARHVSARVQDGIDRLRLQQQSLQAEYEQLQKAPVEHGAALLGSAGQAGEHELRTHIANLEKLLAHGKDCYHRFAARGNQLHAQFQELGEREAHLKKTSSEPRCPLCEQQLFTEQRALLAGKIARGIVHVRHQQDRLQRVMPRLKEKLIVQNSELEKKRAALQVFLRRSEQAEKIVAHLADITMQLDGELVCAEQARVRVERGQRALQVSEQQLAAYRTDATFKAYSLVCSQLQEAVNKLAYDPAYHLRLKEQLVAMQAQELVQASYTQYAQQQRERFEQVGALSLQRREQKKKLQALCAERQGYQEMLLQGSVLGQQRELCREQLQQLRLRKEAAVQKKAVLEEQEKTRQQLVSTLAAKRAELGVLISSIEDYDLATQALGKNGVQALIIENALPEIEAEANNLLAKLTDNQAHILLEATRDLKGGGTKETLDIKISDSLGIRPYELFSGGRSF
jgi:exonuclease SbcC